MTNKRPQEFIDQLKREYDAGASMVELSKKYNTDCCYQFRVHGIKTRSKEEYHEWKINHRPRGMELHWNFDVITTQEQAYIAGFIMADGYLANKQIGLRLKKQDKDFLEKIKNYFNENIVLQEEPHSYSFVVSSEIACRNLRNLGMQGLKTEGLRTLPTMDATMFRHFIRGYFDADGTVFVCNDSKGGKYLKANICSPTLSMLECFQNILKSYNIECTINTEKRIGKTMTVFGTPTVCNHNMYRLFFRKKESIYLLYRYLYKDTNFFLNRKKRIFDENIQLLEFHRRTQHVNPELI